MTTPIKPGKRVLVVPAPTEIGMEIIESLRFLKEFQLVGAGINEPSSAAFLLENYVELPMIDDPSFIEGLKAIVRDNSIDVIFPAHDDVLLQLSPVRGELGAALVAPEHSVVEICSFKSKTYRKLLGKIETPDVFDPTNIRKEDFPVFVKPDRGQGSRGARKVNTSEELETAMLQLSDPVVCEYLPGEEYTIDCFSSRERGLQFCAGRKRKRIVNGIAVSSEIVENALFNEIAEKIQTTLGMTGAWFFQLKAGGDGQFKLLEIGPRIAGTMALNRARGVNFAALSLLETNGVSVEVVVNDAPTQIVRNLTNRFNWAPDYDHLFIDYDDTILLGDTINTTAIAVITQCVNDGKAVHLLSRHNGDLVAELKTRRIFQLFDTIEHLTSNEEKSKFIFSRNAIFVDDSFRERKEVWDALGIPSLDVSQLPLLLRA